MATSKKRPTPAKADLNTELRRIEELTKNNVMDPKATEVLKQQEEAVRLMAMNQSAESLAKGVTETGLKIGKYLSDVQAMALKTIDDLSTLQEAVKLERTELERLHGVDVVSMSLDSLLADYRSKEAELKKTFDAKVEQWKQDEHLMTQSKIELKAKIDKERTREEEEYNYKKEMDRKRDAEEFADNKRLQEKDLLELQETKEKAWRERETTLKAQEEELIGLRRLKDKVPEMLKAEADKQVAIATSFMKRDYEHKITLTAQTHESALALMNQQIASLKDTIAQRDKQIAELRAQVDAANANIATVTSKALDSASGQQALAKVSEVLRDGAPTRTK